MQFSLHIKIGDAQHFLQKGPTLASVQRDSHTLQRWMGEMGVEMTDPLIATYIIYLDGEPYLELPLASIKRKWQTPKL